MVKTYWGDRFGQPLPFKERAGDAKPDWRPKPLPAKVELPPLPEKADPDSGRKRCRCGRPGCTSCPEER